MSKECMYHVSQALAGSVGVLCLYLALFLYESEEGHIQNKLESWWLQLEYTGTATHGKVAASLRRIAALTSIGLDRLFGQRIFSIRAAWPSAFFAGACMWLVCSLVLFRHNTGSSERPYVSLLVAVISLLVGATPAMTRSQTWIRWVSVGLFFLYVSVTRASISTGFGSVHFSLSVALVLSIAFYMLSVGAFRWAIRRCSDFQSSKKILISALGLFLLAVTAVWAPLSIAHKLFWSTKSLVANLDSVTLLDCTRFGSAAVVMMGLGAVLPLALFVLLLALVPINRIAWSLINRPLYAAQRHKVVHNRKLLGTVGVVALAYALPGFAPFIRAVVGSVGIHLD